MNSMRFNPPLPAKAERTPFSQTIELLDGEKIIASAHWSAPADGEDGVVQLVDLHVLPKHRRVKHGMRLLHAVIEQAQQYQRLRRRSLRRIWLGVQQKTQIHARAFLTDHGFHHVSTVADLHKDQDLLIYMRSFD